MVKRLSAPETPEALADQRHGFDNSSCDKINLGTNGFPGKLVPSVDWHIGPHGPTMAQPAVETSRPKAIDTCNS